MFEIQLVKLIKFKNVNTIYASIIIVFEANLSEKKNIFY